jgi:cell wall-associated NlpC family hydrolase
VLATFAALAVAPAADAGAARHPAHSATARQPAAHARASAASRGRIALDFALAQRGKPYVYGGTGPAVYDCSGLVQRAWRVAGVAIPRTTQQQAYTGKAVPLNEIQPGDLVIFYAHASHVGIYAGGGKVVVAPHQGARVMLEPMKWMPIYAVRRPR